MSLAAGSANPLSRDELVELIGRLCDGTTTVAERDALDRRLAADSEARFLYIEHLDLHARLQWRQRGRGQGSGGRVQEKEFANRNRQFAFVLALAATVVLALTAWFVLRPESRTLPPDPLTTRSSPVAMVSDISSDAVFVDAASGGAPMRAAIELATGPVKLAAGRAQVMYYSGAVVDLVAPCEFEITGPNSGFLHRGRLDALVPQRAAGFTVDAPGDVRVTDLGTRFTLTVGENQASMLRVITGLVELRSGGGAVEQLAAGHAVSVAGGVITNVAYHDQQDTLAWPRFEQINTDVPDRALLANVAEGHPPAELIGRGEIISDCFGALVPVNGQPNGGALAINASAGQSGRVVLNDPLGAALGDDGVTIEAWVRLADAASKDRQPLVQCKRIGDPDSHMAFQLMVRAGATTRSPKPEVLAFCVGDGQTAHFVFSSLAIRDDRWHHISAAYDPQVGSLRFTLDDQIEHVAAPRVRPYATRGPVIIGAHSSATGHFDASLNGCVDELRLSRGVLPIDALLTAPSPSSIHNGPQTLDESKGDAL